jgi:hypothetical protein
MEKVTKILKEKNSSIQSFWISTETLEKQFSSYQAQNKQFLSETSRGIKFLQLDD